MGLRSLLFIRFLCNPSKVGAICESSRFLAKAISEDVGIESATNVVELGPGNGALTRGILPRLSAEAKMVAVELDETFCRALAKRYPALDIHCGSAVELPEILQLREMRSADVIVSGLPWAIFSEELQRALLSAVVDVLDENGCFTTFGYVQGAWMPAGKKFRALLNEFFGEVEKTPTVWLNYPPAFTYKCKKPRKTK